MLQILEATAGGYYGKQGDHLAWVGNAVERGKIFTKKKICLLKALKSNESRG